MENAWPIFCFFLGIIIGIVTFSQLNGGGKDE